MSNSPTHGSCSLHAKLGVSCSSDQQGTKSDERPPGFEHASPDLADEVERRLDEFLAEAAGKMEELRAPLSRQPPTAAAVAAAGGEGGEQADVASPQGDAAGEKRQEDEGRKEEEAVADTYALNDPVRPFTVMEGCRWAGPCMGSVHEWLWSRERQRSFLLPDCSTKVLT